MRLSDDGHASRAYLEGFLTATVLCAVTVLAFIVLTGGF
jgi:hypothetical protein